MAVNSADLRTIVNGMSFGVIRTLAGKLQYVFGPKGAPVRVRDVCIDRLFKWLLLFSASGILQASSFRPVLAVPYRPGPDSTAAAPIIFFDAGDNDADECIKRINKLADKPEFKNEFPVGGSTRWFVVLLNCVGTVSDEATDIIPRVNSTVVAGYSPAVIRDEHTLTDNLDRLGELFAL
jgi:hypothetical protein